MRELQLVRELAAVGAPVPRAVEGIVSFGVGFFFFFISLVPANLQFLVKLVRHVIARSSYTYNGTLLTVLLCLFRSWDSLEIACEPVSCWVWCATSLRAANRWRARSLSSFSFTGSWMSAIAVS